MASPGNRSAQDRPAMLRRLYPTGGELTALELVRELSPGSVGERPLVMLNMVASVDGHVTIAGRSGGLGNRADRELFRALRTTVDAVMVGAGTVRAENYGPMVSDPRLRAEREARGLEPVPLALVASVRLDLSPELRLFNDPDTRVVVITGSAREIDDVAARVEYLRTGSGDAPDLPAALRALAGRGVRSILCEGGPSLNGSLLQAGLVDELWVCVSPKLVGGDPLTMVAGLKLTEPLKLDLVWLLESGGHLFARYRARRP